MNYFLSTILALFSVVLICSQIEEQLTCCMGVQPFRSILISDSNSDLLLDNSLPE